MATLTQPTFAQIGQQYWNPTGEYEPHTTLYTLTVFLPPRPPPTYLPSFLTRLPVTASPHHIIRPSTPHTQNFDHFERSDLSSMRTKTVKIKAHRFPADLRCKHVQEAGRTECREGCYVLEKGGEIRRWRCGRGDCEGHVYCGNVRVDGEGVACFGKSGERVVCFEGLP